MDNFEGMRILTHRKLIKARDFASVPIAGLFSPERDESAIANVLIRAYMTGRLYALIDAGVLAGEVSWVDPRADDSLLELIHTVMGKFQVAACAARADIG